MHEMSIAASLVETAARCARENGAERVRRLNLRVGALTNIEQDALTFCFPMAAEGTVCAGAELAIVEVPATGTCAACGARTDVRDPMDPCPGCGQWPLALEGGRDLQLESLEVD